MKSIGATLLVIGALIACAQAAAAANLSSSAKLEVKIDPSKIDEDSKTLWDRFGEWCAIAEWHPAVRSCSEGKEGDAVYRTLSLQDGGKIKEKFIAGGPLSYRYAIVESPLPVKNYEAEFGIKPDADDKDEVDIVWSSTYDAADGKEEKDARATIDGIFKDGIASIKTKLPKKEKAAADKAEPAKN